MDLERGRDLFRGVLILASSAVGLWADRTTGVVLTALVGVLILQSALTNWCPVDLVLRPLGVRSRQERRSEQGVSPDLRSGAQRYS